MSWYNSYHPFLRLATRPRMRRVLQRLFAYKYTYGTLAVTYKSDSGIDASYIYRYRWIEI